MGNFTRVRRAVVVSALGAFVLATGAGAAVVANGNFETGDFTGWSTMSATG
jgi:hypothetical protein